ncbi:MAG: secretin N-terminal domain-containing protein [Candidatus Omnitrophota bacterium]
MKRQFLYMLIFSLPFLLPQARAQEVESGQFGKTGSVMSALDEANRISLDIKGMDVVDVLKMLATRSGMNIVIGKNVTGKVTLFLKNVDVKDVFEIILLANDLAYEKKENIINVMTQKDYELLYGERFQDKKEAKIVPIRYAKAVDLAKALVQIKSSIGKVVVDEGSNTVVLIDAPSKIIDMENFIRSADAPIKTKVFELKYGTADKLKDKLQEAVTKNIGSVSIDERTNKIAVTDYLTKLAEIEKLITAFDEKTPQVLIDAQIVEVRPTNKFEMGVDWDYWIEKYFKASGSLPLTATDGLSIGTADAAPNRPGQFKAILEILQTIGDTKILSSPRIMVLNNQESRILVGTKEAYITSTVSQSGDSAVTAQSVNFVDTGIKLYVTPTINRDGFVTMKIKPEISSAVRTEITSDDKVTEIPIVSTSEAETTVMVKDGVTIIIGGLKKDEKIKTVKKIPLLGDIPLLGMFFRSTIDENNRTELVILLTPHLMSGETPYTEFEEISPQQGAVLSMERGKIVSEKFGSNKPAARKAGNSGYDPAFENTVPDYYSVISKKINEFAKLNSPEGKKGKVDLRFSISSDGNLADEPQVISATDDFLVPYSIKAVKQAAPFPYFPGELKKAVQAFRISLLYE